MWKDSYKIGNDLIDKQHRHLFETAEHFLNEVKTNEKRDSEHFHKMISYLKSYAIEHFSTEEKYQEQIGYPDIEMHKTLHKNFVNKVLDFDRKLIESNFNEVIVQNFLGFITTWLVYHVSDVDQRIKSYRKLTSDGINDFNELVKNTADVISRFSNSEIIKITDTFDYTYSGDAFIHMPVISQMGGTGNNGLLFIFPTATAFEIIKSALETWEDSLNSLYNSALTEIVTIIAERNNSKMINNGVEYEIGNSFLASDRYFTASDKGATIYLSIGNIYIQNNIT